jgi:outer membrane beta-barrel protein
MDNLSFNKGPIMGKTITCLGLVACLLLASTALAEEQKPVDKDLEYFWGSKRKVETIQKRQFLRDGRHEFTLFSGAIPNDDFFVYYPIGARYNWYFSEDFSFELNGAYLFESASDLEGFLETNQVINVQVYLPERLMWYAALDGQWTPIHGKFSAFTTKLTHFDINFSFGAGVMGLNTLHNKEEKMKYAPMGNLGAGMRFYLTDWVALRLDYRQYFYVSGKDEYNGLSWPAEITLGVSFFTSAPK